MQQLSTWYILRQGSGLFRLLLLLLVVGLGIGPAAGAGPGTGPTAQSLTGALNPNGTLKAGLTGSFDATGFDLFTAPDGRPAFRPAGAKRTQGAGDENWQDGFALPGTSNVVRATAVAASGDVYVGGISLLWVQPQPAVLPGGTARAARGAH